MARYPLRLVLVTGTPRSGTTAVGKMLSLGRGVSTLHEPFNLLAGIHGVERYFEIPGTGSFSREKLDRFIWKMSHLDLSFKRGTFFHDHGAKKVLKHLFGGRSLNSYRLCRMNPFLRTIIWKDPFGCFMTEYVSRNHGIDVLATVRNPWAVSASFKRMGWSFDVIDIADRLKSIGFKYLDNLGGEWPGSSALNGALLWHLVHSPLLEWSRSNTRIHFVNLDHILADPVGTYARLYSVLDLPWDARIASMLAEHYSRGGGRDAPKDKKAHDSGRNLQTINAYWQDLLNKEERAEVSRLNEELWTELKAVCI